LVQDLIISIETQTNKRDVGKCIDELGDVATVGIVVLAPVYEGRLMLAGELAG
jgi:hypothetical protein